MRLNSNIYSNLIVQKKIKNFSYNKSLEKSFIEIKNKSSKAKMYLNFLKKVYFKNFTYV